MRFSLVIALASAVSIVAVPLDVSAQSDAEQAFQQAKAAYENEQFQAARDLLIQASQTDDKNPDIFLWLGRSEYQLGNIEGAMAAWRQTLALAPEHAYAQRMLDALQLKLQQLDVRIQIIKGLLRDNLAQAAYEEIQDVRRNQSPDSKQLKRILLLEADAQIRLHKPEEALHTLQELATRDPQADSAQTRLLKGRAKAALIGDEAAQGLQLLRTVIADFPDTPQAAAAEYHLLAFRIAQGEPLVEELAEWTRQHQDSPLAGDARAQMASAVGVFLQAAKHQPQPERDEALSDLDREALAAASHAYRAFVRSQESRALTQQIVKHIEERYVANQAHSAAAAAVEQLLGMQLPESSRQLATQSLDRIQQLAATAELEDILFRLQQDPAAVEPLAQWIAGHSQHPKKGEAQRRLLSAHLAAVGDVRVTSATELTESDRAALKVAGEIYDSMQKADEALNLTKELAQHFLKTYSEAGAHNAAIAGLQELLKLPLPASSRLLAHSELAAALTLKAVTRLTADVQAGRVESGPLPGDLAEVVAALRAIGRQFPRSDAWQRQAALAAQVHGLSGAVPWPALITQVKPTQAWAIEIALPVVEANVAPADQAIPTIQAIVQELSVLTQPSARGLAVSVDGRLLAALDSSHASWPAAVLRHIELMAADSRAIFNQNMQGGQADKNAELTALQKEMLDWASRLLAARPASASAVLERLSHALAPWSEHGHQAVVEQAYSQLETNLPAPQKRQIRLALAQMWTRQALANHQRLLDAGLQPSRKLDPLLEKALLQCYQLQAGLAPDDPFLAQARQLKDSIVNHYQQLEFFDTAEAALLVKVDPAVPAADAHAAYQRAGLKLALAQRELARQLQQHQGRDQISLTPAFREALGAYQQFIADGAAHELADSAVSQLFAIGRLFEGHEAYAVAAEVYADLERFATDQASLSQAAPGEATVAGRAALARAAALHTLATRALAEASQRQPQDAPPPAQLSDEFAAAIAAYESVVKTYPDTPQVSEAIGQIMAIALHYAQLGGWDVADSVYASLQQQELPLRRPERLVLARAMCQVGKVLPEHSQQLLTAIMLWEQAAPGGGEESAHTQLAQTERSSPVGDSAQAEGDRAPSSSDGPVVSGAYGGGMSRQPAAGEPAAGPVPLDSGRAAREAQLLAAVRTQQSQLAARIASMRDEAIRFDGPPAQQLPEVTDQVQQAEQARQAPAVPELILSEAEIARQQETLDAAYQALQALRQQHPNSAAADQAREEIMVIINHWRSIRQWDRAAGLAKQFLEDNPRDAGLPTIRHEIARDYLAWAAAGVDPDARRQEVLEEVGRRYELARDELAAIIDAFPDLPSLRQQAQWEIAVSYLSQARVIASRSRTLARGQFVRAASELLRTAELYHDHPQIDQIPQMLWGISQELVSRRYFDEAIVVWTEMTLHYPGHPQAEQAALHIAQTYQNQLRQPLRAVEAYLELNFARGGGDQAMQDTIFQIAAQLMNEKRWVESLHVLETFVDSFPRHAQAGQALTMIGQIHQANEVWEDAIEAYRRVILEYDEGNWAQQAKWSIAECTINLSRWQEATGAYRDYQQSFPEDEARITEAARRLVILKDLDRYQRVVDEPGQRKAFDAQYQIATIVRSQLSNPVKAIIEYRKVAASWPESHLADDALFQAGMIFGELGETAKAREEFLLVAQSYPASPLADDALFQVGVSYEQEADQLANITRGQSIAVANDIAQKEAYHLSQFNRRQQRDRAQSRISELKAAGKTAEADNEEAFQAAQNIAFDFANAAVVAKRAEQQAEVLTAAQMADRQDKINASLRMAVASFRRAANVASADMADDALLRMAQIYDQRLKDEQEAMSTWLEIVKQYSGTAVAEDASWKIAAYYQQHDQHAEAIEAYKSFLRNYRRSPKAGSAQAAIAENFEQLGKWVEAMDAYTNYITNFPEGPLVQRAKDQIQWIKTYRL